MTVSAETISVINCFAGNGPLSYEDAERLRRDLFDPSTVTVTVHCIGVWLSCQGAHPASRSLWGAVCALANVAAQALADDIIPSTRADAKAALRAASDSYWRFLQGESFGSTVLPYELVSACQKFVTQVSHFSRARLDYTLLVQQFGERVEASATCTFNDLQGALHWRRRAEDFCKRQNLESPVVDAAAQECDRQADTYRSVLRREAAMRRLRSAKPTEQQTHV